MACFQPRTPCVFCGSSSHFSSNIHSSTHSVIHSVFRGCPRNLNLILLPDIPPFMPISLISSRKLARNIQESFSRRQRCSLLPFLLRVCFLTCDISCFALSSVASSLIGGCWRAGVGDQTGPPTLDCTNQLHGSQT